MTTFKQNTIIININIYYSKRLAYQKGKIESNDTLYADEKFKMIMSLDAYLMWEVNQSVENRLDYSLFYLQNMIQS